MTASFRSVVATRRGSPDVLEVVENELREPARREVRVSVLATPVGRTDVDQRHGDILFAPKVPFVPGYALVGTVDAIGDGVTTVAPGARVAALTGRGGYAEYVYIGEEHLVGVPEGLDSAEAAVLVLNYVTAHQLLHRSAKARPGDRALVVGASGGVGTALLQLARLAGVTVYGVASSEKRDTLVELGAVPIDYRTEDFVAVVRAAEPGGLDLVFDGVGGENAERGLAVLRRGGTLVEFAPGRSWGALARGVVAMLLVKVPPGRKSIAAYGISALYRRNKKPFMTDLPVLFALLAERKIEPIVAVRIPLLEAARANVLLESGAVTGTVVLVAPQGLS